MGLSDQPLIQLPAVLKSKDHFDKRVQLIHNKLLSDNLLEYQQSTKLSEYGSSCPSVNKSKYDLSLTEEKITHCIASKAEKVVYKMSASVWENLPDLVSNILYQKKYTKQELHDLLVVCLEQRNCSLDSQHRIQNLMHNYNAQLQPVTPKTTLNDAFERPLEGIDTVKGDRVSDRVVTPMKSDTAVTVSVKASTLVGDDGAVHRTSEKEDPQKKGAQSLNRVSDRVVTPKKDDVVSKHLSKEGVPWPQSRSPNQFGKSPKYFKEQTFPATLVHSVAQSKVIKQDARFQPKLQYQLQFSPFCQQCIMKGMCLALHKWVGTASLQWKLSATNFFKDHHYHYQIKYITIESMQINWVDLKNTIIWKTLKSEYITAQLLQISKVKCKKSQQIVRNGRLQQPHHGEITWVNKGQLKDPPSKHLKCAGPHVNPVVIPGHHQQTASMGKVLNEIEGIDVSSKVKPSSRSPEEHKSMGQEITATTQCITKDAGVAANQVITVHPSEPNHPCSDKRGFHTLTLLAQKILPHCYLVTLNISHVPQFPESVTGNFICAPHKTHVTNGKRNCNTICDFATPSSSQQQIIINPVELINGYCNESCQGTLCHGDVSLLSSTALTLCSFNEATRLTFNHPKTVWTLTLEVYILFPVHQVVPLCITKLQCAANLQYYQQLRGITVAWSSHLFSMDKCNDTQSINSTINSSFCGNPKYYHQIHCYNKKTFSVDSTNPKVFTKHSQDSLTLIDVSVGNYFMLECIKIQETDYIGHTKECRSPCIVKVINFLPKSVKNDSHVLAITADPIMLPGVIVKQVFHGLPSNISKCEAASLSDCSCYISASNVINKCYTVVSTLLVKSCSAEQSCKTFLKQILPCLICLLGLEIRGINKKCIQACKRLGSGILINIITRKSKSFYPVNFTHNSSAITEKSILCKEIIKSTSVGDSYCDPKALEICICEATYTRVVLYLWKQNVLTEDFTFITTNKILLPIAGLCIQITRVLPHIECGSDATSANLQTMCLLPRITTKTLYTVKSIFFLYGKTFDTHAFFLCHIYEISKSSKKCFIEALNTIQEWSFCEKTLLEVKMCLCEPPQELPPPKPPKDPPFKLPPYAPASSPFLEHPVLKRRRIIPISISLQNSPVQPQQCVVICGRSILLKSTTLKDHCRQECGPPTNFSPAGQSISIFRDTGMPLCFYNNASLELFQTELASSDYIYTPMIKKLSCKKTNHGRKCASNNAGGGGTSTNYNNDGWNTGRNRREHTPINNGSKGNNTDSNYKRDGDDNDKDGISTESLNVENDSPHDYHPQGLDIDHQQLPYVISSQHASIDENRIFESGGRRPINFTAALIAYTHSAQQSLDYDYLKGNNAVINPVQSYYHPPPVQPIDEVSGLQYLKLHVLICVISDCIARRKFASNDR